MEKLICGVDLGGTKLAAALFKQDGSRIDMVITHDHTDLNPDEIVLRIAALVRELLSENNLNLDDLLGVGVGLAGHILHKEGMIITSSNFKNTIHHFPLVGKLEKELGGVKVFLDNDANAQALGEFKYGAGRDGDYDSLVYMTISTGIGAGLVLNRKMYRGQSGTAGEIGHTIIDIDADSKCTCGNYGCLMALSSGLFFPELYKRKLEKGIFSTLGVTIETAGQVDGHLVNRGFKEGDPVSIAIVEDSADMVGFGIFNIFQLLNPDVVVLGGGLMNFGDSFTNRIREKFCSLTNEMMCEEMGILVSEMGTDAGLLGAAALVLE
ncbi:MAG: ROK family protein [Spirochaetales bacterium]|nr:ROK family protein [Spirochaetales bacterium]